MSLLQTENTTISVGQPNPALFDLDVLEAETQDFVREREDLIHAAAKRMARDAVKIGGWFAEVKDRLSTAQFEHWRQTRMKWSERTVYNLMAVHQRFSDANFAIENVAVSALYLLAGPETPPQAIEAVKQMAGAGMVSHAVVKEVVAQAREVEEAANRPALFDGEEQAEELDELPEIEAAEPVDAVEPGAPLNSDTQPEFVIKRAAGGFLVARPHQDSGSLYDTRTEAEAEIARLNSRPGQAATNDTGPRQSSPVRPPAKAQPTTDQLKAESAADHAWRAATIRLSVALMPVKAGAPRDALVTVTVVERPELLKSKMVSESGWPATLTELSAQVKEALAQQPAKTTPPKPAVIPSTKAPAKAKAKAVAKAKATKSAKKVAKK